MLGSVVFISTFGLLQLRERERERERERGQKGGFGKVLFWADR